MRCGYSLSILNPSLINVPSDASGACKPRPIKLKNASKKIAFGIVNIVLIIITPAMLGSICLKIILDLTPNVREANTNSCSFNFMTCARTTRDILVHPVIANAIIIDMIPGFNTESLR